MIIWFEFKKKGCNNGTVGGDKEGRGVINSFFFDLKRKYTGCIW